MAALSPHLFRAYDIRGIAHETVTEELCRLVGHAFGSELRERYRLEHPRVIVGRDARLHSPALEQATIEGLLQAGCTVLRIGQVPSPVNYFAVCHCKADGSIQITASHNPKEDNGLKLQLRNAEAFSGAALQALRQRIEEERFLKGKGSGEDVDAITPYLEKVTSKSIVNSQLSTVRPKVVVDFGNGVAGPVYGAALKKAGLKLIELFAEPDGTFPNHIADPSKHDTLKMLQETVKREKAHCGIAFDGDGDRVGFVDERGQVVSPDYLLLLLAEDHLKRNPGASIVYTVSMSSILETEVKRLGGTPVLCVVGHSFVGEAMRKRGSHLGGEQSGHFFCGEDFYDHDDALVAALRILSIFAPQKLLDSSPAFSSSERSGHSGRGANREGLATRSKKTASFSSLFSHFPKVFQASEWRPHCSDEDKGDVIRQITAHFEKTHPCLTIDGVRIDFGDGAWALIRQSNTSAHLSICMEARSQEKLKEVEKTVREHVRQYRVIGE